MWFWHCDRRADSRAALTAGSSSRTRIAMIAITTSSSTKVNPKLKRMNLSLFSIFQTCGRLPSVNHQVTTTMWISSAKYPVNRLSIGKRHAESSLKYSVGYAESMSKVRQRISFVASAPDNLCQLRRDPCSLPARHRIPGIYRLMSLTTSPLIITPMQ